MNKRALEMATGTIIAIVLGLIILVILIIFAQQQVAKGGKKLDVIGKKAEYSADRCQSIVLGRFCAGSCASPGNEYEQVNPPPGGWTDCAKLSGKSACCKKKEA